MRQYRPSEVMEDYVATHEFILDILDHLHPVTRDLVDRLIRDTQPAWDDRRKMFGVLFPDAVATVLFDGLRYDWEL